MIYEPVIGLEVHAELSTKTKIFCGCSAKFGADINTHCCPVCTGMPGSLPVLNRQVVHYAAKMGLATNCRVNRVCKSDRKNYFYPDLPKAYQISQFDVPICEDGRVDFYVDGEKKSCRFERIHFEEDAGKLVHDEGEGTIVDFNRCGVPLIEMVTRPDLHSSAEAKEFLEMIKTTLSYLQICDCKMEEGSIRCDINVSIREKGSDKLGTRVEMKNVNTFSGAVRAIDYEIQRQIDVLEAGGTITQETRRWDDVKLKNFVMRTKEDAQDYRYFPDPDLIAVEIDEAWMQQIASEIPELPLSRYERYVDEVGLTPKEARQLMDSFEKATLMDDAAATGRVPAKLIANWILSDISKYLNDKQVELSDTKLTAVKLVDMIEMIEKNVISGNAGKKVLVRLFETDETAEQIVEALGLKQVSDEGAIQKLIDEVLAANEKSVNDYKNGKKNAMGFLVGQCMKVSKGKANPKMINQMLAKTLNAL
ncbi:MAG: Asp-tRNA(Asn)/Glu-tRNA(Gln) amidotransferase subunit GatB [Butyricicoccaceae bacterium]